MLISRKKTCGCVFLALSFSPPFFLLAQLLLVSHYCSVGFHFKNNWNPCQGWRLHNANKPDLNVHLVSSHLQNPQLNAITPSYTRGKKEGQQCLLLFVIVLHCPPTQTCNASVFACMLSVAWTPKRTFQPCIVMSRRPWLNPSIAAGFWLQSDLAELFFFWFVFYVNLSDTGIALWHSPHFSSIPALLCDSEWPLLHAFHRRVYFKMTLCLLVNKKTCVWPSGEDDKMGKEKKNPSVIRQSSAVVNRIPGAVHD